MYPDFWSENKPSGNPAGKYKTLLPVSRTHFEENHPKKSKTCAQLISVLLFNFWKPTFGKQFLSQNTLSKNRFRNKSVPNWLNFNCP
jgi:hypothetical protein